MPTIIHLKDKKTGEIYRGEAVYENSLLWVLKWETRGINEYGEPDEIKIQRGFAKDKFNRIQKEPLK